MLAERFFKIVAEPDVIGFDIETTGLNIHKDKVVGLSVAGASDAVYVPLFHAKGRNIANPEQFITAAVKALKERAGAIVGHNIKFDALFFDLPSDLHCSMIQAHLIAPLDKGLSLDAVAKRNNIAVQKLDILPHIKLMLGNGRATMADFWRLPADDILANQYAINDAKVARELYKLFMPIIDTGGLRLVYDVERKLIPVLVQMQKYGIKIDETFFDRAQKLIDGQLATIRGLLPAGFNPRAKNDIEGFLGADMEDAPLTANGNRSYNAKFLASTANGKVVNDYRLWSNLANTFIKPLKELHTVNGRVHPSLNAIPFGASGTVTGRFSCSNPNLQQVPKHNKELSALIRQFFIADDGFKLVEIDYSQCEPRLYAHYSQSKKLLDIFENDKDVHSVVASMLNVDRNTVAKRVNMGLFGGLGANAMAATFNLPLANCVEWTRRWHNLFPEINVLRKQAADVSIKRGYVRTILGRRGAIATAAEAYKGVSRLIQGSNADIVKLKMLELSKLLEGHKTRLLMTIHDSFLLQVHDSEFEALMPLIIKLLEAVDKPPLNLRIKFKVDYSSGRNWAEVGGLA